MYTFTFWIMYASGVEDYVAVTATSLDAAAMLVGLGDAVRAVTLESVIVYA